MPKLKERKKIKHQTERREAYFPPVFPPAPPLLAAANTLATPKKGNILNVYMIRQTAAPQYNAIRPCVSSGRERALLLYEARRLQPPRRRSPSTT